MSQKWRIEHRSQGRVRYIKGTQIRGTQTRAGGTRTSVSLFRRVIVTHNLISTTSRPKRRKSKDFQANDKWENRNVTWPNFIKKYFIQVSNYSTSLNRFLSHSKVWNIYFILPGMSSMANLCLDRGEAPGVQTWADSMDNRTRWVRPNNPRHAMLTKKKIIF